MQPLRILLTCFFAVALTVTTKVSAAEAASFTTVGKLSGISGNHLPGCDAIPITYDVSFSGASQSSSFTGCCGTAGPWMVGDLTNTLAGDASYSGYFGITVPGELCCFPSFSLSGVPSCYDVEVSYQFEKSGAACSESQYQRSTYFTWYATLTRNSNSTPIATWEIKDATGAPLSNKPEDDYYQLPADGMSEATPTIALGVGTLTWTFTGTNLGCTFSNNVLRAGTNVGQVQITAVSTNGDVCLARDFKFNLHEPKCRACSGDVTCSILTDIHSLDAKFSLGASRRGGSPAYLQLKAYRPSTALGTPAALRCDYIVTDLEKITNGGGLRQVRALENTVNILTNSSTKYTIEYYYLTNLLSKSNGLYRFIGTPWKTVSVELVGGNTNQIRIQDSLELTARDYQWITNGWTLTTGGGLRSETLTETNVSNVRTEVRTIRNGAGVIQQQNTEKWTNSSSGQRLIQEIIGSGVTAQTNDYVYDSSARLTQVTRGDGSWQVFNYDTLNRQTNRLGPIGNKALTTTANLCRSVGLIYTNSVVSGSGDDFKLERYTPRLVTDSILGVEISRRYTVVKAGERRDIVCPNPGATWNDTNNIVTTTFFLTDALYLGSPSKILNSDGTVQLFTYSDAAIPGTSTPLYKKVTGFTGAPNATTNSVVRGTKEETWKDKAGRTLLRILTDVSSSLVLSRESYTYDAQGRLTRTDYFDGTIMTQTYDCCHLVSRTERDGSVTTYTYDEIGRQLTTLRDGVTISNVYNAAGSVVGTYRIGTNGTVLFVSGAAYDLRGRLTSSTNALNQVTTFAETVDATGQTLRTNTLPDLSTRIEISARDGVLTKVLGSTVLPARYHVTNVTVAGVARLTSQEIKLLTNGNDSSEWIRSVNDGAGHVIQTEFPDLSTNRSIYSSHNQLVRQVDPDGVQTLLLYDNIGQVEYRVVDINRNNVMDTGGTDRIARAVTDGVSNSVYGATVRRTLTYVWTTDNSSTPTLVSERDESVDGHESWTIVDGMTSNSRLDYLGGGVRRMTQTAPDGTQNIQDFVTDRLFVTYLFHPSLGILEQQNFVYDEFNRRIQSIDARNGTTTSTLDNLDRTLTVTTPAPGPGQSAQVSTLVYDAVGRVIRTQAPDGLWTTNTYYTNGLPLRSTGARSYPVEYTYDYGGRVETMKTRQNYAANSNVAVTTWKYDALRGFLTNKLDAVSKGAGYTYTKAGRLASRTWARGTNTTYTYNNAGDLQLANYSDSTPDVNYTYDRMGRASQITGATTNDYTYTTSGLLLSENAANKFWNYFSQNRLGYDAFDRRMALTNLSLGITHSFGYDVASRLQSVSTSDSGVPTLVTYSFLSNSSLAGGLIFQQNGATRLTTTKTYDYLNRLGSIVNTTNAVSVASSLYGYNLANQRTALTNADGSRWVFGYDSLGQVTNGWRYWADSSEVLGQVFNYAFDDIGNRTSASSGASGALRTQTYAANLLNQYTNRTVPGFLEASGTADASASITVNGTAASRHSDYFRGEVSVNNSGAAVVQWMTNRGTLSDTTAAVSRVSFVPRTPETNTFDVDGNLTLDGLWSYTWDAENRLTRIETRTNAITSSDYWRRLDFTYDYMGRRVRKQVSGWAGTNWNIISAQRFFYDGWNLIGQVDEITSLRQSFVWGNDLSGSRQGAGGVGGLLALIIHNGTNAGTYFYGYDGNGNAAVLVNAADGTEAARYEYGPFGELTRASGVLAKVNPLRFSTKYQDEETELLYYGYRYLSVTTGRWLNRDSMAENGGVNLYGFVANNPVSGIDLLGLALYAFDGTGNNDREVSKGNFTWVLVLAQGYRGEAHYENGVGSSFGMRAIGGLTGLGGRARLENAYQAFLRNYNNDDKDIDIIGFSRGAAMAREFANMIYERGDGSGKRTVTTQMGKGSITQTVWGKPCKIPDIRYVGLFDTVGSFGVPGNQVNIGYNLGLPPNVKAARQAVAADEQRYLFPLTPLGSGGDGQDFREQRFPGDHSDIGRGHGLDTRDLSYAPLQYIWSGGITVGVPFGPLPDFIFTRNTTPHDLSSGFPYNIFPKRPR